MSTRSGSPGIAPEPAGCNNAADIRTTIGPAWVCLRTILQSLGELDLLPLSEWLHADRNDF